MQINFKSLKNAITRHDAQKGKRSVTNSVKKLSAITGWNNVKFIRFFIEYFNDPWIRWQTKAMFVLWIMTWLAGFAVSAWALYALPLTFVHTMLTAAFAFSAATIFWVSLHNTYMGWKLSEEEASDISYDF